MNKGPVNYEELAWTFLSILDNIDFAETLKDAKLMAKARFIVLDNFGFGIDKIQVDPADPLIQKTVKDFVSNLLKDAKNGELK